MSEAIIVPVDLGDGVTVYMEATPRGRQKVGALKPVPIGEVMGSIEKIAKYLGDTLRRIRPRKASVEFGVEIGLQTGLLTALICQGSGKANLKITLEWGGEAKGEAAAGADGKPAQQPEGKANG
jgi:Trypsin-co-occurring domain 1